MKFLLSSDKKHFYIPVILHDAQLLSNREEHYGHPLPKFRRIGDDIIITAQQGNDIRIWLRFRGTPPASPGALITYIKQCDTIPFVLEEPKRWEVAGVKFGQDPNLEELSWGGTEGQRMLAIFSEFVTGTGGEWFMDYD